MYVLFFSRIDEKTFKHNCCLLKQMNELGDNIKFDHGYTASSPPIVNVRIHVDLDTLNLTH